MFIVVRIITPRGGETPGRTRCYSSYIATVRWRMGASSSAMPDGVVPTAVILWLSWRRGGANRSTLSGDVFLAVPIFRRVEAKRLATRGATAATLLPSS